MRDLEQLLVADIETHGPIGFDEYQANALYSSPHGFYRRGGGVGRRRDFVTSPEVGPLFGAVLARALDHWWDALGSPSQFTLVEAGAGPGTLARTVLAGHPRCAPALSIVLVEVGEVQWDTHPPAVVSRPDMPTYDELGPGPVVVLANELLDNLPVQIVERTAEGWDEVAVGADGTRLVEQRRPLEPAQVRWCQDRVPAAGPGSCFPVQAAAASWLTDALSLGHSAGGGRVVAIDYARTSADMAAEAQTAWLRTYRDHDRSLGPLDDPGSCDITCDVATDQLALVAPPAAVRSQADFLRAHGIDELVAEGRRRWASEGLRGGLAGIEAQSRVPESEALLDSRGLGGFAVMEWTI